MNYIKLTKNGIKNLLANKLRTGLAMLGIVIGIGSVISLMSLGESSQQMVKAQIQAIGSNLLLVSPGAKSYGLVKSAAGSATTLTIGDAEALTKDASLTAVKLVSPEFSGRAQVVAGRYNTNTQIVGALPLYADVRKIVLVSGTFFTETQNNALAKVAVLGPTVAKNLFPTISDPVGQTIRIGSGVYEVIGITQSKGANGNQNQDDMVIVPLNVAQRVVFGANHLTSIALEVTSEQEMQIAENQVTTLLLKRHAISQLSKADFSVQSQQDILDTANQIAGTFSNMLTSVAIISLLVGGVGIMNIMLMIVIERTQEIGLRKALGATKEMIVMQFLIESTVLSLAGGIVGIIVGLVGFSIYIQISGTWFVLSVSSLGLSFVVSMVIGMLFGWYPARRAAELQPIDALRYE